MDSYRANPLLVEEHGRQEDAFRTGGYAHRQILELTQNAADALHRHGARGRVEFRLVDDDLYCANEGEPFTQAGLEAVCHAYLSDKRGEEIGRFGLGFKSILAVTSRPSIFSRSVSFDFDADSAREELIRIAPDADAFPVLRLPRRVDVQAAIATDRTLAELASWAQTVVRLPLAGGAERLLADLQDFPTEFLLFASDVSVLSIVVQTDTDRVTLEHRCDHRDDKWTVADANGGESDWLVWHRQHRPSDRALSEVSETLRRGEVRVSYAAPLDDTQALGRFWAHFPLKDVTSTRGILNAPWQVNDDRTNLLDGAFNDEVLQVIAEMVVAALPELTSSDDPARHFDYLPARGREAPNDADRRLAELVPELAARTPCVPNAEGVLQRPSDLVFPRADLRLELETYGAWHNAPGRPVRAPHWTCYKSPTRRARLRSLLRRDDEKASDVEVGAAEWLERIVPDATDEQAQAAIRVLLTVKDAPTRTDMRAARVLPDAAGTLRRLSQTTDVFLRGNMLSEAAGLQLVRQSLLELPGVEEQLRDLGFVDVDPQHELRKLATTATRKWSAAQWTGFWDLVSEVTVANARQILSDHVVAGASLKVRCRNGTWQDIGAVVVPGLVAPEADSLALDVEFHDLHLELLREVGVAERPVVCKAVTQDLTFLEYLRLQRDECLRHMPPRGRPDAQSLHFDEEEGVAPLHVLRRFGDVGDVEAQTAWTAELLAADVPGRWHLRDMSHRAQAPREVAAPHLWAAQTYGLLKTPWGPRPSRRCLAPGLTDLAPLLPVASNPNSTKVTTIPSLDDVPLDVWREFLGRVPPETTAWALGDLLVDACRRLPADEQPAQVPAVVGTEGRLTAPAELLVATTEDEVRALVARSLPFVATGADAGAELLTERWGARPASSRLRVEIASETPGEAVPVLDRYRGLRPYSRGVLDGWSIVECGDLARRVTGPDGTDVEVIDFACTGDTVYYVDTLTEEALLSRLSDEFDLTLTATVIARILGDAQDEQVHAKVVACRTASEPADKLLELLPTTVLEARLPVGLLDTVRRLAKNEGERQVADLFLHLHGYDVLAVLKHDLNAAGFAAPDTWAGSSPAIAFVRRLGFPAEYAGTRTDHLDADLTVLGPPRLGPLHDFQVELAAQIRGLVTRRNGSAERALLFLPTGAGKTRVTVEALAHAFIEDGLPGPLLWIAQSEELCEQAVQTWSTVWREVGNQPLRICRLWSRNEVALSEESLSVVVATDAKLDKCRSRDEYDWLKIASAVVVDEAHTATGAGIDATLKWLGLDGKQTARPLLGLTATPFKGTGEEANRRLASRFGNRQLDVLGDDPYGRLQKLGVLARVEHRILDGASVALDAAEAEQVRTFRNIPQAVLDRVGRDEQRTERLLADIEDLPDEWPVLVFTPSVLSAQILAALLRVRGIEAASVSGATRMHDRRRSIEAFRRGEIRVMTNCNVLTQGFDAPAVRALYIARPTFSPNAYIQMVGRGLRGPANGGKDECLVVNVADTFDQFGENLAYKEFDYLWDKQG